MEELGWRWGWLRKRVGTGGALFQAIVYVAERRYGPAASREVRMEEERSVGRASRGRNCNGQWAARPAGAAAIPRAFRGCGRSPVVRGREVPGSQQ
eukprot:scaffold547_cov99-Isochrysis_galbana.AAC.7